RRAAAHFTDVPVHERVVCEPPVGRLDGYMIHDSIASEEEAREKTRLYGELGAGLLRARRVGGFGPALIHAAWAFARGFVLKAGFLDGVVGWKIAVEVTRRTWLRYRLAGELAGFDRLHYEVVVLARFALFIALMLLVDVAAAA